jgi:hypothetical protein
LGVVAAARTEDDMVIVQPASRAAADRGEHALKGIDGSWRLYQLSQ